MSSDPLEAPLPDPFGGPPSIAVDDTDPALQLDPVSVSVSVSVSDPAPPAEPDDAATLDPDALSPPLVPRPPLPPPRPKPPILPERTAEGAWRTEGITIERAAGRAFFVTVAPPERPSLRIYVQPQALARLLTLATAPAWEPGPLWRALCSIPLDRLLPSRRLEEELRALLTTFGSDFRT